MLLALAYVSADVAVCLRAQPSHLCPGRDAADTPTNAVPFVILQSCGDSLGSATATLLDAEGTIVATAAL